MSDSALPHPNEAHHRPRDATARFVAIAALMVIAGVWLTPLVAELVASIDFGSVEHAYAIILGFVVFDAVVPIFPSESLLNTGSNLAAQTGSNIVLWKLIAAGSIGAIVGDSILYWLSRTVLHRFVSDRVARAQTNPKLAQAMSVMGRTAPTLIVFGRFVPGLRFMIGATMGLTRYPYPRFVLWGSIGGTFWAAYTCVFSYLVATVISGRPVISIALSVVVTTALLGVLFAALRRSWNRTDARRPEAPGPAMASPGNSPESDDPFT